MVVDVFVRGKVKRFIFMALIILVTFLAFAPILWLILNAFKTKADILAIPPKWFFTPTLENFRDAIRARDFFKAYTNSIIICASSVFIGLVFGVPMAYGLSRFNFKGKNGFAFWVLSTRFAPPVFVLVPFFMIFRSLSLVDTKLGMIIIYLIICLPLIVWVMYSFFRDVPIELEEAALVDGARPFQVFTQISLPIVAPGIVAVAILAAILCWNDLIFAVVLSSHNAKTMPITISSFASYMEIIWGGMAASSTIALVPILIFTLFIQKYLVAGLTFGAVKN